MKLTEVIKKIEKCISFVDDTRLSRVLTNKNIDIFDDIKSYLHEMRLLKIATLKSTLIDNIPETYYHIVKVHHVGYKKINLEFDIVEYKLIELVPSLSPKAIYQASNFFKLDKKGFHVKGLDFYNGNKEPFLTWVDTRAEITNIDDLQDQIRRSINGFYKNCLSGNYSEIEK